MIGFKKYFNKEPLSNRKNDCLISSSPPSPTFYDDVMGRFAKTEKLEEYKHPYLHLLEHTMTVLLY